MHRLTEHIETLQTRFEKHPYFAFVSDPGVCLSARRCTLEDMAFYVMFFADLSRMLLRDETSGDPLQQTINAHTFEDDSHWRWYLADLQRMGADRVGPRSAFLAELFAPDTAGVRQLCYRLTALAARPSPADRHALVRAIEATGDVGFRFFGRFAAEHSARGGDALSFFGDRHRQAETAGEAHLELEHATDDVYPDVDRALAIVDETFAAFTDFVDHLHARGRAALVAA